MDCGNRILLIPVSSQYPIPSSGLVEPKVIRSGRAMTVRDQEHSSDGNFYRHSVRTDPRPFSAPLAWRPPFLLDRKAVEVFLCCHYRIVPLGPAPRILSKQSPWSNITIPLSPPNSYNTLQVSGAQVLLSLLLSLSHSSIKETF